jgi:tRNA (cmo5U34)-methyltransferase
MNEIKIHFSKTVDDYDTVANKVVFKNDELHGELIGAIDFDKNKRLDILDLGCGTGHGMLLIAKQFPNARITGVDFSTRMIEKAKEYLSPFRERIKLLEADFNDRDFDQRFDAVVSAIAIHNSTHYQKERLFKKIFESLNDGGSFINADFYEHDSEKLNNDIKNIYRKYLHQNLSGDELNAWLRHAFEEDMPMKLSSQFSLLQKIGFSEYELIWIFNNEAIYVARK